MFEPVNFSQFFLPVIIIGVKISWHRPIIQGYWHVIFQLSSGEEMEVQQQQRRKAPARGGGARGGRGARGGKKAAGGVVTIPDDSDEDDFGSTR
jgi:hypothetical protein